jgi:hypothetical protein
MLNVSTKHKHLWVSDYVSHSHNLFTTRYLFKRGKHGVILEMEGMKFLIVGNEKHENLSRLEWTRKVEGIKGGIRWIKKIKMIKVLIEKILKFHSMSLRERERKTKSSFKGKMTI